MGGIVREDDFHAIHPQLRKPYFHITKFERDPVPEGQPKVLVNDRQVVRAKGIDIHGVLQPGDETACTDEAIEGSRTNVFVEDRPIHLLFDRTEGAHGNEPSDLMPTYGETVPPDPRNALSSISIYASQDVLVAENAQGILMHAMRVDSIPAGVDEAMAQDILDGRDTEWENDNDPDTNEALEHHSSEVDGSGTATDQSAPMGTGMGATFDIKVKYDGDETFSYWFFDPDGDDSDDLRDDDGNIIKTYSLNDANDRRRFRSTVPTTRGSLGRNWGMNYSVNDKLYIKGTDLIFDGMEDDFQAPEKHHAIVTVTGIMTHGTGATVRTEPGTPIPGGTNPDGSTRPDTPTFTHTISGGRNYTTGGWIGISGLGFRMVTGTGADNELSAITFPNTTVTSVRQLGIAGGAIYSASISGNAAPMHPDHSENGGSPGEFFGIRPGLPPVVDEEGNTISYPMASASQLIFLSNVDPRISPLLETNLVAFVMALPGVDEVRITSAYRSPAYNQSIGGSRKSMHMRGLACDVVIPNGMDLSVMLRTALDNGITGIGIYEAKNFFHLDVRTTGRVAWGPNGSRTSLPSWAKVILAEYDYVV